MKCPHCGFVYKKALVFTNGVAKCEYCGSVLKVKNSSAVIGGKVTTYVPMKLAVAEVLREAGAPVCEATSVATYTTHITDGPGPLHLVRDIPSAGLFAETRVDYYMEIMIYHDDSVSITCRKANLAEAQRYAEAIASKLNARVSFAQNDL